MKYKVLVVVLSVLLVVSAVLNVLFYPDSKKCKDLETYFVITSELTLDMLRAHNKFMRAYIACDDWDIFCIMHQVDTYHSKIAYLDSLYGSWMEIYVPNYRELNNMVDGTRRKFEEKLRKNKKYMEFINSYNERL